MLLGGLLANPMQAMYPESIQEAIKEINARCPTAYPEVLTPVPESGGLTGKSQLELFELAKTWNPSLLKTVGTELATRGDDAISVIRKGLTSESPKERKVAVKIFLTIIEHQIRHSLTFFPDEIHWRHAQRKVREKYHSFIPIIVPLCNDDDRSIRSATVQCLVKLEARQKDVSEALLSLLDDSDEYLAQNAANVLYKYIGTEGVDLETLYQACAAGMKRPLPGGKGAIIKIISQQSLAFQRRCIPLFIEHLKWTPDRDTMGGTSGQFESLELLTSLKEASLIEHLPFMMNKKHRHRRQYLEAAVEAAEKFGPIAKSMLPLLKITLKECSEELKEIESKGVNRKTKARYDTLKKRAEILKKAITSVQS